MSFEQSPETPDRIACGRTAETARDRTGLLRGAVDGPAVAAHAPRLYYPARDSRDSEVADDSYYQNFYEFPIKSLNYLVIICFDL